VRFNENESGAEGAMNKSSVFFVVFAAFCWGLNGVWSRTLSSAGLSFFELNAARSLIAVLCVFIFLFIADRKAVRINIKDVWLFVFTGGFGYALCYVCYFYTATILTLSATTILIYTAPYMVMLISAFAFKERVTMRKAAALLIAFAGCVMTIGVIGNTNFPVKGILSGLTAAFLYSLYTIFSKVAMRKYKPITVAAYSFLTACIVLLPFCSLGNAMTVLAESANWARALVFGALFTALPSVSYLKGLEKLEPGRASIIAFVEPLTAAAAGIVLYDEMLSAIKITGIALIFLALVLLNWERAE